MSPTDTALGREDTFALSSDPEVNNTTEGTAL